MKNKVQLITYADGLGKDLKDLDFVLCKYFSKEIGGVHVLPFYPSSADRGFSPLTHLKIDEKFGSWGDLRSISKKFNLTADLIVNHISDESEEFQDFLQKGEKSKFADFFITTEKFSSRFSLKSINRKIRVPFLVLKKIINFIRRVDFIFHIQGVNRFVLQKIYRPRLGSPFESFEFNDGKRRCVWCTFSRKQIDLDVNNKGVRKMLKKWIENLKENGVNLVRLDAVGYAIKKRGTTSFMIPKTYNFIKFLAKIARQNKMAVLPEIHNHYSMQVKLAETKGADYAYDFCLPLLVLHSIFEKNGNSLKRWIKIRPHNQITTLDTHDGIGIVDVEGLIDVKEAKRLSDHIFKNGGNATMRASGTSSENVDVYQINTTYYSALNGDDRSYLIARAIQFFVPGIPQVYYVGLLAGKNDEKLLKKTGNGRDVNRHHYSIGEIKKEMKRPVVKSLMKIMRFRNEYPAFCGKFEMQPSEEHELVLRWRKGVNWCKLSVNFKMNVGEIEFFDLKNKKLKKIIL